MKGDPLVVGLTSATAETIAELAASLELLPEMRSRWFVPVVEMVGDLTSQAVSYTHLTLPTTPYV